MIAGMGDEECKEVQAFLQGTPIGLASAQANKAKAPARSTGRSTSPKPKAAASKKPATGAKSTMNTQPQAKAMPYKYATDK